MFSLRFQPDLHCTTRIILLSLEGVVLYFFFFFLRNFSFAFEPKHSYLFFLCLLLLYCSGEPTSVLVCGFGSLFQPIPATQTSNSRKSVLLLWVDRILFLYTAMDFLFPLCLCQFCFLFLSMEWCGLISQSLMSTNFLLTATFGLCGHLSKHIDMQPT